MIKNQIYQEIVDKTMSLNEINPIPVKTNTIEAAIIAQLKLFDGLRFYIQDITQEEESGIKRMCQQFQTN